MGSGKGTLEMVNEEKGSDYGSGISLFPRHRSGGGGSVRRTKEVRSSEESREVRSSRGEQ